MRADDARPSATRASFLGIDFDPIDGDAAAAWLRARRADDGFAYVVTPNVDHVVRLDAAGDDVGAAYRGAALCLCDSRVLARIAAACDVDLPVVPGSDLTARLFADILAPGDAICLIGGDAETIAALAARWPGRRILHHAPPMGLRDDPAAQDAAARFALDAHARFTLIAVGSPQQELIAARIAALAGARGTGLCIGASIDFLTGRRQRAPLWMRRHGLEWLHRLLSEPRRLWRRYLLDGPRVFVLAWRWRRRLSRPAPRARR